MIYRGEDNEVVWYLVGGFVLLIFALLISSIFVYRYYKPIDSWRLCSQKTKVQAWGFVFLMFSISVGLFNYSYRYYYNPPFFVCPECETKQRFLHREVWNGEWSLSSGTNGRNKVMVDAVNCEKCSEYFQMFTDNSLIGYL